MQLKNVINCIIFINMYKGIMRYYLLFINNTITTIT